MKKLLKLALLLIMIPAIIICEPNQIAYLKDKLITTPKEQAATKWNMALKFIPSIGISICIDWLFYNVFNSLAKLFVSLGKDGIAQKISECQDEEERNILNTEYDNAVNFENELNVSYLKRLRLNNLVPGISFLITYYVINKIILKKLENAALLRFIKDWEFNKTYTPGDLHTQFEELYKQLSSNRSLNEQKLNALKTKITKLIDYQSNK